MAVDQAFLNALQGLQGKIVKVTAKNAKELDVTPGAPPDKIPYYLVQYKGVVMVPAVRPFPETNPNGVPCLYLQEQTGLKQVYAISVDSIEEVDDELPDTAPQEIAMGALQNPNTPQQ